MRWHDYLASVMHEKFQWGVHDCCVFPAKAHKQVTGIDYLEEGMTDYRTRRGAMIMLRHLTGVAEIPALMEYMAEKHGFEETEDFQDGDVAVVSLNIIPVGLERPVGLGLVVLPYVWTPGKNGLVHYPLTNIRKGWKVWQWQSQSLQE